MTEETRQEIQKLYKVLVDGKSCNGGDMEWDLPKLVKGKWIPGKWQTYKGKLKMCFSGIHLTTESFRWYKNDCKFYVAEAKKIEEWQGDKCLVRKARLLKEEPFPDWFFERNSLVKE